MSQLYTATLSCMHVHVIDEELGGGGGQTGFLFSS